MNNNHPNRSKNNFTEAVAIVSLDCETVHGIGLTAEDAWKNAEENTGDPDIRAFAFEHHTRIKTPKKEAVK